MIVVQLTEAGSDAVVFVNASRIVTFFECPDGTMLTLAGSTPIKVVESAAEIAMQLTAKVGE